MASESPTALTLVLCLGLAWSGAVLCPLAASPGSPPATTSTSEHPRGPIPYRQRVWKREQGLPDNCIRAILQARDGYLWIGTRAGLVRFDGLKFTLFNHANYDVFESDDCTALAQDRTGALWIGTSAGLLRYDGRTFTRYSARDGLIDERIRVLCASRTGELWIGTERGMNHWRQGRITSEAMFFGGVDAPQDRAVRAILEDDAGTVWASNVVSLHRWDPQAGRLEPVKVLPAGSQYALSLVEDGEKTLWLLGSHLFYRRDGVWHLGAACGRFGPDFSGQALLADQAGHVWIGSERTGLFCFDEGRSPQATKPTTGQLSDGPLARSPQSAALHHFDVQDGLSDNQISCLCEDGEGNLWIGTLEGGLNCWQPRRITTHTPSDGLAGEKVWTLYETRAGRLWAGTETGLSQLANGRWTSYTQPERRRNIVRSLAEDTGGRLWIGTLGEGLDCWQDGRFTLCRLPGELSENKVRVLRWARDGTLWIGSERGLHCWREGRVIRTYTPADGLAHPDVRALLEDRVGNLWIGTYGGGLNCRRQGRFATLTKQDGLSNNFVSDLCEDREGNLWVGTERGLNRIRDGGIATFTTHQGLPDDQVNEILEDDAGRLWIGCSLGIYRVQKQDLLRVTQGQACWAACVLYDESDGLLTNDTNGQKSQPAGCKSRDGRLWFATPKGAVVIDPAHLPDNPVPPPVVIEQVTVAGFPLSPSGERVGVRGQGRTSVVPGLAGRPSSSQEASDLSPISGRPLSVDWRTVPTAGYRLAPGSAHTLEIQYTAITFAAPQKAHYRYRLFGFDPDWIEAGTRRTAYYAYLPPGQYRFQVIASNNHGRWNEAGASLALFVASFFWQTWPFRVGCGLFIGAALAGLVAWRWRQLRRLQELEKANALARQRERIARDIHDGLSSSTTQIGLLTEQALRSLAQPLQAALHLREVAAVTGAMSQALADIAWAIDRKDNTLRGLLAYLRRFAAEYLASVGIQGQFCWPDQAPATAVSAELRYHLFLALKEALNNVAKHAHATQVSITVALSDSNLTIHLADNGKGFDPSAVREAGHGLENMRQRLLDLGGQCELFSQPGRGTKLILKVPLGLARL